MLNGKQVRAVLATTWTAQEVADRFSGLSHRSRRGRGVALNAVHNWVNRQNDPLPVLRIRSHERDIFRFIPSEVRAWAKRNGHIEVKVKLKRAA